ncbi:MAG TPA: hypothetical protein PKI60_08255 [Oscillospiraceae bacterium]|nr:hypothetical protein [Oscillospiraceae bacterium]
MIFNIKSRVIAMDKKVKELLPELEKRMNTSVKDTELSAALNSVSEKLTPKHARIIEFSNQIVTEWEKEAVCK